jgi:glycosyltransferase involved in cell wall biosynthesis
VEKAVSNATFNGINLLNNTQTNGVAALANADATSRLTVSSWSLSLCGSVLTFSAGDSISVDATSAEAVVALVNTSTWNHRWMKRVYQAVLRRFDVTVHGSDAQRRFWAQGLARNPDNATVIYNGVDSGHFEINGSFEAAKRLRASLGVAPEAFLIGTVGRLAPEKNQDVLLTSLRRLRAARVDAHLVLAGDGALRAQLQQRAARLGIAERVHFIGEIDDVRPVLAALDVFVLPSVAIESFSNAALEAMAMGRPVILSDIGGAREMIQDGVEGYVVSPPELPARLPAILSALYSDQRKRQLMGIAARARVVNCFSVPAMVERYRGLLNNGDLQ